MWCITAYTQVLGGPISQWPGKHWGMQELLFPLESPGEIRMDRWIWLGRWMWLTSPCICHGRCREKWARLRSDVMNILRRDYPGMWHRDSRKWRKVMAIAVIFWECGDPKGSYFRHSCLTQREWGCRGDHEPWGSTGGVQWGTVRGLVEGWSPHRKTGIQRCSARTEENAASEGSGTPELWQFRDRGGNKGKQKGPGKVEEEGVEGRRVWLAHIYDALDQALSSSSVFPFSDRKNF